jgi:phosphoribosyl-AMP cyclohydrolase
VIGSKIVCHEKKDSDGSIYQHKYFVAKGYSQVPGQDFKATFSAIAKYPTFCALLALTACENYELHQIVGAYLQGDLYEGIYMLQLDGLKVKGKEGWSLRLRKLLYGLKQAGRQWKKKLDDTMAHLQFTSNVDECPYIYQGNGEVAILVLAYVDDAALVSRETKHIEWFKKSIGTYFPIKDLGKLHHILGVQVTCNCDTCTITLNQTAYIRSFITHFGIQNSAPVSTPLATNCQLTHDQSPTTPEEHAEYKKYANSFLYLEGIGAGIYATQTRPDIQHAMSTPAQFGVNPGKPHLDTSVHFITSIA